MLNSNLPVFFCVGRFYLDVFMVREPCMQEADASVRFIPVSVRILHMLLGRRSDGLWSRFVVGRFKLLMLLNVWSVLKWTVFCSPPIWFCLLTFLYFYFLL